MSTASDFWEELLNFIFRQRDAWQSAGSVQKIQAKVLAKCYRSIYPEYGRVSGYG